jgi:MFS superfamily sulfate permease-like transporter
MINQIIGLIMALVGFLILKYFPDIADHQISGYTMSAILIAIILILVGIYLVFSG